MMVALLALIVAGWDGISHQSATNPADAAPREAVTAAVSARTIKTAYHETHIPKGPVYVTAVASCPAGFRVIGGGATITGSSTAYLVESRGGSNNGADEWDTGVVNPPGFSVEGTLTAQAICSRTGKPVVP